jgi:tetratricopeptide (TPR) repeat protein
MIFNDEYVSLNIIQNNFILNITGYIKNPTQYKKIVIVAPNPIDRMINYSGSGLPFPNEHIAFENTPNYKLINNSENINVQFKYPNSFYSPDGKNKILKAISVEPQKEAYYSNLGTILLAENNVNEAIIYFNKALNINPKFIDANFNLGNAYKKNGYLEKDYEQIKTIMNLIESNTVELPGLWISMKEAYNLNL